MSNSVVPDIECDVANLRALRDVIAGPLGEIAARFSRYLADRWPHTALVIFTRECTGRPRKVSGPAQIIDRVRIDELEELKAGVPPGSSADIVARFAGATRRIWLVRDDTDTLLVLVPRSEHGCPEPAVLTAVFALIALSIRQQVTQSGPDYLAESRAAATARARTIAELTAAHEAVLAEIVATLRSPHLDDRRSRSIAADAASAALVAARAALSTERAFSEEPAAAAFRRLRTEISPLLRRHDLTVEFVPPEPGNPLIPGEVASGARAMTHAVVLALTVEPGTRLRIAWHCDSTALRIDVRDQSAGVTDLESLRRRLHGRVQALRAEAEFDAVPGWGTRTTIRIPLEIPVAPADDDRLERLNPRQREVLAFVASGMRNKVIAAELGVAESTVKFHIAGILKKLEVTSRGEAAAVGLRAGLAAKARNRAQRSVG
ncbi:LuxR C-terminal-related transcriptional regulator [Nocardia sp. NPDC050378]|uniref:helix-turn-helix transcriptional regulator n=1 Tax=Nocardia sp. NPDC050378 TaxID=3155400 RepID=UPI0033EBFBEF